MSDHAVQLLLDATVPVDSVPETLARAWPDVLALELGLALATACHAIEQMYSLKPDAAARVMQGWRLSALIGGDVLALQRLGRPHECARDLLEWWENP